MVWGLGGLCMFNACFDFVPGMSAEKATLSHCVIHAGKSGGRNDEAKFVRAYIGAC